MTHSEFNFYSDLTFPFFKFLLKNNFDICNEENLSTPMFPYEVFLNPFKTVEENEKAWESWKDNGCWWCDLKFKK